MKSETIDIHSPVSDIKGIGPKKAEAFSKLGITGLEDVLYYYPRSYEDYRSIRSSCDVKDGDEILIQVKDVWDSLLLAETIEAVANYGLHVTVLANLYVKGKIAQWTYYQPWENANEHADYRRVIVSH